jgi:predicted ATPase/DNA-binding SARP family transcriptional activator
MGPRESTTAFKQLSQRTVPTIVWNGSGAFDRRPTLHAASRTGYARLAAMGGYTLSFEVLGALTVRRDGELVDIGGVRNRTLLAVLLSEPGAVFSVDRLIDAVWGVTDVERQPALWTAISRLRSALDPDRPRRSDGIVLLTEPTGYRLNVALETIDAVRFERLTAAGTSELESNPHVAAAVLRDALDLWRGPPFCEFDHAAFAAPHIARLNELRHVALSSRLAADLGCGRAADLIPELDALLLEHPDREEYVSSLMLALHRAGRSADALRTSAAHRRHLRDRSGLDPSTALLDLEARILSDDLSLQVRPARRSTARRTDNLRAEPNELVERPEIAEISDTLEPSRVITLLGPGGIGKSRSARAIARRVRDSGEWADGVWYIDLTTLDESADGPDVATAAATVIGAGHHAAAPSVAEVGTYLDGRSVLLVLDNCEHVLAGVADFIPELFEYCSTTAVLATSRVRLGLPCERPVEISTLSPAAAAALFEARTAELSTGPFPRDDVARLCDSLDNYPLAIELAAARTRAHSAKEIVERLERHPPLAQELVAGSHGGTRRRHASLDAALDWSISQLDESARTTLHRAAVFSDGFDLAAAESVVANDPSERGLLLDDLGVLVEHHLLVRDRSSERFAFLEPIRRTIRARVPVQDSTRQRHGGHYLRELGRIGSGLTGRDEAQWWDLLRTDRAHLRDAVRWAADRDDVDALEAAMQWMPLVVANGGDIGPSSWAEDALTRVGADAHDAPFTTLTAASGHLTSLRFDAGDEAIGQLREAPDPRVRAITAYLASLRFPAEMIRTATEMAEHAECADEPALIVLAAAQARRADAFELADEHGNPTLRAFARFCSYVSMTPEQRRLGAPIADECYVAAIESNNALVISQGSALRGNAICRTGEGLDRGAPLILDALEIVLRQRAAYMGWTLMESMAGMLAVMRREPFTSAVLWAAVDATGYVPSSDWEDNPEPYLAHVFRWIDRAEAER